jgi:hypothetical protein
MNLKDFASESGHWYAKDGTPAYTIVGKNGKERATTLRDARNLGLVPSVTTITGTLAKPALDLWKQKQVIFATQNNPWEEDETEEQYVARILNIAKEESKKAAEEGTRIHGAIEQHYLTGTHSIEYGAHVVGVVEAVGAKFGWSQEWIAEKSFADELFGGKIDLHSKEVVIDFKTKEFTEDKLPDAYDENIIQLAAYRHGLGYPYNRQCKCANVFISRNVPGLIHIVEHEEEEIKRGFEMFKHLLALWMNLKRFGK